MFKMLNGTANMRTEKHFSKSNTYTVKSSFKRIARGQKKGVGL